MYRGIVWGILASLGMVASASAGLLPVNVTVVPEGDNYRFSYSVLLQSNSILKTGDFFTIYDFNGLIDGSNQQPGGFNFTSSLTGTTPDQVVPYDDPSKPNLTWTYTGDTKTGEIILGNFSALSRYGDTDVDNFTGQSHRQVGDRVNNNITETEVPVPLDAPEPGTALLALVGIPVALGVRRWRRG
jgi:hypothetical protein